jgi:hypothetical protein
MGISDRPLKSSSGDKFSLTTGQVDGPVVVAITCGRPGGRAVDLTVTDRYTVGCVLSENNVLPADLGRLKMDCQNRCLVVQMGSLTVTLSIQIMSAPAMVIASPPQT